jgi:hypothetical protein
MTVKNLSSIVPPNLANKALIADVQAFEPYGSKAFNRQLMGVIQKGVYSGFTLSPAASGLSVVVSSAGKSAAAVELGQEWLINVRQKANVTLAVPAGRLSTIVLTAFYDGSTLTDQVDADSTVKAAQLLVVNAGSEPVDCIILGQVNVPSNATSITTAMIVLDNRDRVSLEGFWNKLDEENIAPKGQWLRTILNKGIKPSLDNVRAAAVDTIGATNAWFKEAWVNSYRGGSIDVEGTIKSGGRLAVLRGDFGIGGVSSLLAANTNLNSLPAENGKYRGVSLLNTPDGATASGSWWFVDHSVHDAQYQYQQAMKFDGSLLGVWFRACVNGTWAVWDRAYSVQNKPTKTDVGLSAVANERQYSAQNNNIGAGAANYAAGDHKHDADYSKLGHTHPWSQLTEIPVQATRWPTVAEVGAAAASHTHPWAQVTGAPVYTTRWPTAAEAGAAPTVHAHAWADITGAPVYTTRWPTIAEIGAQAAGSYAATSHTHAWADVTGAPVYTTRWPTAVEAGAAPTAHTHAWAQVTGAPVYTTRWPTIAEIGAQAAGSYAAAAHTHDQHEVTVLGNKLNVSSDGMISNGDTASRHAGMYGIYDPAKTHNIWSMGTAYKVAADGSTFGNLYGLSYKHTNNLTGGTMAGGHQAVWCSNGVPKVAIGDNLWTAGTVYEAGEALASRYAGISHTHPWSQITGVPVQSTRWPNASEVGLAGLSSSSYNSLLISTSYGTLQLGAINTGHQHYTTSMTNHWFNKDIKVQGEIYAGTSYSQRVYHEGHTPTSSEVGLGNVPNTVHTTASTVNTVPVRDGAGDITSRLFKSEFANQSTVSGAMAFRINNTTDNYLRFCSDPAAIRTWLGAQVAGSYQAAGSYAASSHTHDWANITGEPVYTTRWPTLAEVGAQAAGSYAASSHTHTWAQVTGAPVYTTRWPTLAEIGAQASGSYAASSHTHTWAQVTGAPVYTTRWPTWAEVSGKPSSTTDFKLIHNSGSANTYLYTIPAECTALLNSGDDLEFLVHAWQDTAKSYGGSISIRMLAADWNRNCRNIALIFDMTNVYLYSAANSDTTNRGKMMIQSSKPAMIYYKVI